MQNVGTGLLYLYIVIMYVLYERAPLKYIRYFSRKLVTFLWTSILLLHSLPGEFTGLQLVSYMYVSIKQMDKKMDAGIDFLKEYALALNLFEGSKDDQ